LSQAHETIAKGVLHDGKSADRDIYGLNEHPPTVDVEHLGDIIGGIDLPVRLVALPRG